MVFVNPDELPSQRPRYRWIDTARASSRAVKDHSTGHLQGFKSSTALHTPDDFDVRDVDAVSPSVTMPREIGDYVKADSSSGAKTEVKFYCNSVIVPASTRQR
jgi:hypothetical protein